MIETAPRLGREAPDAGADVARHMRKQKAMRWHIDYLSREADVVGVWQGRGTECARNHWTSRLPGATVIVPKFGSSDCRCETHLYFFARRLPSCPQPCG